MTDIQDDGVIDGPESFEAPPGGSGLEIWAVGGGKGGIGKSFVTTNLAIALAQRYPRSRIVVVDADLGGANVHTCFGIAYPSRTLADFIDGRVASLDKLLLPTALPNLSIISGASDVLSLANPQWSQKQKVIRHLLRLQADHLILDLGAGTTFNVLDFFNLASRRMVVATPEPTSIQNAYGFIKSALYRQLLRRFNSNHVVVEMLTGARSASVPEAQPETMRQIIERLSRTWPAVAAEMSREVQAFRCHLLVNMSGTPQDSKVYSVLRSVSRGYLDIDLQLAGSVPRSELVLRSVDQMTPLLLSYPASEPAERLRAATDRMLTI